MKRNRKSKCEVCGNFTVDPIGWDICPVCFWEDDGLDEPDRHSPSNYMTLAEGRAAFAALGAVEQRFEAKVRPPKRIELPENHPPAEDGRQR
ncbi:MAG: hypothetical protein JWQ19_1530 [Subtercola sp.]|nr:hypothetical protein [Subtercola sp.]